MAQENIDTRTPEEMLQQAYDRIIKIATMVVAMSGWKHDYKLDATYKFDFDKNSTYKYVDEWFSMEAGLRIYIFNRVGDGGQVRMTQFSQPAELAN